jgi:hypothetical protein
LGPTFNPTKPKEKESFILIILNLPWIDFSNDWNSLLGKNRSMSCKKEREKSQPPKEEREGQRHHLRKKMKEKKGRRTFSETCLFCFVFPFVFWSVFM